MSVESVLRTLYLAFGLMSGLVVHEYVHALAALRLGDPTPKGSGRLTLNPRPHVDVFGTLVLPGILLLPVLFGRPLFLPFAYARPQPLGPFTIRDDRKTTIIALAGPVASIALALAFGLLLRLTGDAGELAAFLRACLTANVVLGVMNIVPLPGLDGSVVLARFLPGRAREVYTNLAQYLALFILLVFFLFPGPIFAFVAAVGEGICAVAAGTGCF